MSFDQDAVVIRIVWADQLDAEAIHASMDGEQVVLVRRGMPSAQRRQAVSRVLHPERVAERVEQMVSMTADGETVPTRPIPPWMEDTVEIRRVPPAPPAPQPGRLTVARRRLASVLTSRRQRKPVRSVLPSGSELAEWFDRSD